MWNTSSLLEIWLIISLKIKVKKYKVKVKIFEEKYFKYMLNKNKL